MILNTPTSKAGDQPVYVYRFNRVYEVESKINKVGWIYETIPIEKIRSIGVNKKTTFSLNCTNLITAVCQNILEDETRMIIGSNVFQI